MVSSTEAVLIHKIRDIYLKQIQGRQRCPELKSDKLLGLRIRENSEA